jgi:hypothetical protein
MVSGFAGCVRAPERSRFSEQRVLPIEIDAIERSPEGDNPPRLGPATDCKLYWDHGLNSGDEPIFLVVPSAFSPRACSVGKAGTHPSDTPEL